MDMKVNYGGYVVVFREKDMFVWVMNVVLFVGFNILGFVYDWGFIGFLYNW